jgi:hypothetical protein
LEWLRFLVQVMVTQTMLHRETRYRSFHTKTAEHMGEMVLHNRIALVCRKRDVAIMGAMDLIQMLIFPLLESMVIQMTAEVSLLDMESQEEMQGAAQPTMELESLTSVLSTGRNMDNVPLVKRLAALETTNKGTRVLVLVLLVDLVELRAVMATAM